jgi:hypothetical protein
MIRLDHTHLARIADDLRAILGDDFDQDTFLDTLDGETGALDVADWLIARMQDAEALADAAKTQADALAARAARLRARSQAHKAQFLPLLDAIGMKKLERPAATISRRQGSLSVQIIDPSSVPTQLCKIVATPDKTAIKAQIEAGVDVPGARLERGPDGVTVRVS